MPQRQELGKSKRGLSNGGLSPKNFHKHLCRANGRGGFGLQTAADPPWRPPTTPEKQTVGTVTNPGSIFELSQCRHCKERPPGPRKGFWVTSGGLSPKTAASVYPLHIIEKSQGKIGPGESGLTGAFPRP